MAVSGSDDGGGVGGAVGLSAEVGGVVWGGDDGFGVGAVGLLVGFAIMVSGNDDGVGVEAGSWLVGVGSVTCGVGWAACDWVAGGSPVVSGCWLHPHSEKPTKALAAAIRIFRNGFIVVIPFFEPAFGDGFQLNRGATEPEVREWKSGALREPRHRRCTLPESCRRP